MQVRTRLLAIPGDRSAERQEQLMNEMRRMGNWLLTWGLACGVLPTQAFAQSAPVTAGTASDQASAFDFIIGTWHVNNHFLVKRLQHSDQWLDFESTTDERELPTDTGNIETYRTSHWPDFVGMAVRLYNPETRQWIIYWTDNRFSRGVLQPPVTGTFKDGLGVFEGNDSFSGRPIIVRYTWQSIDHDHARWTQAFSADQGQSWETNWIMEFTRMAAR
jgi:hypothetical protein